MGNYFFILFSPVKCLPGEHVCIVKGVEVCVSDEHDPDKECDCIVTEQNLEKRKEMDWDLDFIHNNCDNCWRTLNADQEDRDGDSVGDLYDICPDDADRLQKDDDNDGIGNECDPDYNPLPYLSDIQKKDSNDKSIAAAVIEKLLEMYYSEQRRG